MSKKRAAPDSPPKKRQDAPDAAKDVCANCVCALELTVVLQAIQQVVMQAMEQVEAMKKVRVRFYARC